MKDSKFWILFIPLFLIVSVGLYFMLTKSMKNNNVNLNNDALSIKEEYQKNNDNYFNVELSNYNVYKYISNDDIKKLLDNKDGLVFIGDATNNISRKCIVVLNEVVSSTSVPEVNYINIKNINDELSDYFEEKIGNSKIDAGTLISVDDGNILKVYYPDFVLDNKELTNEEKNNLFNSYKEIVNNFIEECDENC